MLKCCPDTRINIRAFVLLGGKKNYDNRTNFVPNLEFVSLTDGMEVDSPATEAGQFEDADIDHW